MEAYERVDYVPGVITTNVWLRGVWAPLFKYGGMELKTCYAINGLLVILLSWLMASLLFKKV